MKNIFKKAIKGEGALEYKKASFEDFCESMDSPLKNLLTDAFKHELYDLYLKGDFAQLEAKYTAAWGKYPPNNGANMTRKTTLGSGQTVDRFGNPTGEFTAKTNTPYTDRAMDEGSYGKPYHRYEVVNDIPANEGDAVPWFGEKGGATQYQMETSIDKQIEAGDIREIKDQPVVLRDPSQDEKNN